MPSSRSNNSRGRPRPLRPVPRPSAPPAGRVAVVLGRFRWRWVPAAAAVLVVALCALWALRGGRATDAGTPGPAVAWLVNAQNCTWSDGVEPAGDMAPETILNIER